MKLLQRALLMLLILGLLVLPAGAVQQTQLVYIEPVAYANPLYGGTVELEEFDLSGGPMLLAEPEYLSVEEAGLVFRQYMLAKSTAFTVYVTADHQDHGLIAGQLIAEALEHTGNAVEGDYLAYQFGGYGYTGSVSTVGSTYYYTLNFSLTYYTTDEQEAELDTAVSELLARLDLEGCPDEQKVRAIYDYICENVTYDNENRDDSNYKLKYTAYAAMINGTAVCQGYANLFYRLALEAGVDARIIAGTGNGIAHAWNIVRVDGTYYNLDSTWDAGRSSHSYYLRCEENFAEHIRKSFSLGSYTIFDFTSDAFRAAYPMAVEDYNSHSWGPWSVSTPATCTNAGVQQRECEKCHLAGTQPTDVDPENHSGGTQLRGQTDSTCTVAGYTGDTFCLGCGAVIAKGSALPVTAHTYTAAVTAPTCVRRGYTTHMCICGDSYVDSYTDTVAHSYQKTVVQPTMSAPGAVVYTCTVCGSSYREGIAQLANPFTDVAAGSYYYNAVLWALDRQVTTGMTDTTFAPDATCTRGQVVTFLYRAAGKPEVTAEDRAANLFRDVAAGSYYYDAVLWAVKQGITKGTSATAFSPDAPCTRGQVVTFLHRAQGAAEPAGAAAAFTDVVSGEYYEKAVAWAVEKGVTNGLSATTFGPNATCTRGQIVTFLYRALGE